jgi:hypothetical protein
MPDPLDWCLGYCACRGKQRGTECAEMPGCVNCLEVVGMSGHVVSTLSAFLLTVRLNPGESIHAAIRRVLEEESKPPRWMN